MNYRNPELQDRLAAEYALGTLRGSARKRFEKLAHAHPELHKRTVQWQVRLANLGPMPPEQAPPTKIWEGIKQRLFFEPAKQPWLKRLGFWQSLTGACAALSLALALAFTLAPTPQAPAYVVMVSDADNKPMWMVSTSKDMTTLHVKSLEKMDVPEGSLCQLWLKPQGSDTLIAIGSLPDQGDTSTIRVAAELAGLMPGELIVTVEKANGTPTAPTSPALYFGQWLPVQSI